MLERLFETWLNLASLGVDIICDDLYACHVSLFVACRNQKKHVANVSFELLIFGRLEIESCLLFFSHILHLVHFLAFHEFYCGRFAFHFYRWSLRIYDTLRESKGPILIRNFIDYYEACFRYSRILLLISCVSGLHHCSTSLILVINYYNKQFKYPAAWGFASLLAINGFLWVD